MKKLGLAILLMLFSQTVHSAGEEVGEIYKTGKKPTDIEVKMNTGTLLNMGDILQVETNSGKIILEVTFPMQTLSKCRIRGRGNPSDLKKGMTVTRYSRETEKDKNKTNWTGDVKKFDNIEMVFIEGGTFSMGSQDGNEKPVHSVTVDSFWIGKYEVTQGQYRLLMGENPSLYKGDNRPVEQVSWEDAIKFCKKFSEKYKVKARLPYEAEWEYACRAGTTTKYYWGNSVNGAYCWYDENSGRKTKPVGTKKPNPYGLYDMSGNVSEWCMDWYQRDYYSDSPSKNPKGASDGDFRVVRGGSWSYGEDFLRSSFRSRFSPKDRLSFNGFRILISL